MLSSELLFGSFRLHQIGSGGPSAGIGGQLAQLARPARGSCFHAAATMMPRLEAASGPQRVAKQDYQVKSLSSIGDSASFSSLSELTLIVTIAASQSLHFICANRRLT